MIIFLSTSLDCLIETPITDVLVEKKNVLTHTSNAKCFRSVTLINIRGLADIIVPVRCYGRHSPKQVMIKRE